MSSTAGNIFTVVTLEPKDVPGAVLPDNKNIEDCSNFVLQRWLECRGLKKTGNKEELAQRVVNCIAAGRENYIFVGVDGGKWYDAKRNIMNSASTSSASINNVSSCKTVPTASLLWAKFPSRSIPPYFNKGHIYTYIAGLQYADEDYEVIHEGSTEKPFRRGSQFVSSDYIFDVYDAKQEKCFYLKAKCFSSFRKNVSYAVEVVLNEMSGAVINGTCECRQSALGRCSHVSAVLLFLSKFVEDHGHDGFAPTSKLREWGLGAKQKKPGAVATKYYPTTRFKPIERAHFDPRPTRYERNVNINNFIANIQHGQQLTMFGTVLKLEYQDFILSEEDVVVLQQKVHIFKKNMSEYMNTYEKETFAVRDAEIQGSDQWRARRTYFFTASNVKAACSLSSATAKFNYVKKNLWQLSAPYSMLLALYYGRKCEPIARSKYISCHLGPTEILIEVGLYANKNYPHLACSPDGLVLEGGKIKRFIEIKCPKILENIDPHNFANYIKVNKKNFYLEYDGKIKIKDNHPYLYQVATTMIILDVNECDFVVWSKINMLVFKIRRDDIQQNVIEDIIKLRTIYYNMYVPEMFLMRIPRNLPLYELPKLF